LSDFQKGQTVVVRLAGGSVTQPATVLGISRAAAVQGYVGVHKSQEHIIS